MSNENPLNKYDGKNMICKCDLCHLEGIVDKEIGIYVGGYVNFAHQRCVEIGNEAIKRYIAHKEMMEKIFAERDRNLIKS